MDGICFFTLEQQKLRYIIVFPALFFGFDVLSQPFGRIWNEVRRHPKCCTLLQLGIKRVGRTY